VVALSLLSGGTEKEHHGPYRIGKETAHMQTAGIIGRGYRTWHVKVLVLLGTLVLALMLGADLAKHPSQIKGYEAYRIAESVAGGHGYSFKGWRWLFDEADKVGAPSAPDYHPTAWEDPLYTFLLAALMRATGDWHMIAGAILNIALFVATVMLSFRLAANYNGIWAGAFAAILIAAALYWRAHRWVPILNHTLLAMMFVVLFALALHKTIKAPTRTNAGMLGAATGLAILACPGAIGFLAIGPTIVLLQSGETWCRALSKCLLVLLVSILILVPWATRNYVVFHEFVPVRTGGGLISFVGTVGAGITVEPATLAAPLEPPWRASSARLAVATILADSPPHWGKESLIEFQARYARAVAGDSWNAMNEAQRDKWLQHEVRAYFWDNPLLSIKLAVWKLLAFTQSMGQLGTVLITVALMGGVLAIASWRIDLLALSLCIGVFAAPFILIVPFYDRYRMPVEPIITVAAIVALYHVARFSRDARKSKLAPMAG
jgi:Dolichyl-phosphate-mannose-protein mannosyltransferase